MELLEGEEATLECNVGHPLSWDGGSLIQKDIK